jgi:polyhydroxyalkanoate synthase subunit PhaC
MATTPYTKPDELAAPLDLLLTNATKPFASRMMPDDTWARLGVNLAKQPGAVAGRIGALTRELGAIAAGKSQRAPARADKRFSDVAWQDNPLLHRIMQAYLVGAETAEGLLDDAHLDWRDRQRMQFVIDNLVEGLAPSNNPLISPLGWKAMIDTGGLSAVRGVKALARDMISKPDVDVRVDPIRPADPEGACHPVADGAAGDQQVLHHGSRAGAQHDRVLRPTGPTGLRHLLA